MQSMACIADRHTDLYIFIRTHTNTRRHIQTQAASGACRVCRRIQTFLLNPRYWTIQEAAQDFFIPRCPSVLYDLASKQAIVCYYRLTVSSVKLFLTGIPRDTCKGPLVNL